MAKKQASEQVSAVVQAVRASGVGKLVGEVEYVTLGTLKPNTWNPNVMTPDEERALRYGLERDGWLVSQALLVWGTDERGVVHNTIIDGEHRWTTATAAGFDTGPVVFMHGLPELQAKKLTIALNSKRGRHDEQLLAKLVRSMDADLAAVSDNVGLDLGLDDEHLAKLLAETPEELPGGAAEKPPAGGDLPPMGSEMPAGKMAQVKMVQLFLTPEQHEAFTTRVKSLGEHYRVQTVTDAVLRAVDCAHEVAFGDGGSP